MSIYRRILYVMGFCHFAFAANCDVQVDTFKELMVVDPMILADARANPGGPWHFSSLLRQMLPAGTSDVEVSDFIIRWLNQAKNTTKINGYDLQFPGLALGEGTVCNWLQELGGRPCKLEKVNPDHAPFRLIAIVNRIDLDGHGVDHAEGRFVFGALSRPTANPVSDPNVFQLPETVIFEYALPRTQAQDLAYWAKAWHTLGDPSLNCTTQATCEPFRQALEAITSKFSLRNLVTNTPNGNPISQIRTSHLASGSDTIWSFHQFELSGSGKTASLVPATNSQAPQQVTDNSAELVRFVNENSQKILTGNFVVPKNFWGGESLVDDTKTVQWQLDGVDTEVRRSFATETCNGCHGEKKIIDGFFHISPTAVAKTGLERVSDFLKIEELPKRSAHFKDLLCSAGATSVTSERVQ